ncbi:MAG: molybdopterin-dependent oxidoreductase [Adlercreutzia sp.]
MYSPASANTLKRVGERGEGKFEDQLGRGYGDRRPSSSAPGTLTARVGPFPPLTNRALCCLDSGCRHGCGAGYRSRYRQRCDPAIGGGGFASCSNAGWVNAKTIILSGINFLETSLMRSDDFFDAKRAGAEIIVVDPHFSTTASKANQWIPLKPGTDGALYLSMISHIIDNKWYNEDYMRAHTSMPFLLDPATGELLRSGKTPEIDPATGEAADPADYLVWDTATNAAVPYDAPGVSAALEGIYEVAGQKVVPVFEQLKASQKDYTTAWAAEKCDIDQRSSGAGGKVRYWRSCLSVLRLRWFGQVLEPRYPGSRHGNSHGAHGADWCRCGWGHPAAVRAMGGAGGVPLPEDVVQQIPVRADRFADTDAGVHVIISS